MATELHWEQWPGFTVGAMRAMEDYPWPGNVRELRNVVERAVYRWDSWDDPIGHIQFDPFDSPWKPQSTMRPQAEISLLPSSPAATQPYIQFDSVSDLRSAVDAHERAILEHALGKHRYNQRQTAKALGLTYDQLRHCMKKHSLSDKQAAG